ncbi:MAG: hypothetical protein J5647_01065 [Spirochaetaceae bacterium]|nr:hypothetical protein [Spirochaetaceae bacterium]
MKSKKGLLSFVLAIFILSGCLANNAGNSTETEEYLDAYCTLANLLWEKSDFIKNNNDSSDTTYSTSYKSNGTISKDTEFVNNELLGDASLKIGMTKDDVYNVLGVPDTDKKDYVAYYRSMFMKEYYDEAEEENFYASTSILFNLDDKGSITKIVLYVEGIEGPYYFW